MNDTQLIEIQNPEFQIGGKRIFRTPQTSIDFHEPNNHRENFSPSNPPEKMNDEVWHEGGCHCGAVKFRVLESTTLTVVKCK